MKNAKRILIPFVGIVLLVCMVFAVACNETPEVEKYTVTVTCDSTKGTATLTPVAENNKYAKGTSVTLEVSAKENYEVSEVKVNGSVVTLTEGKYTFTVQGNTEIVVSFNEKQPVVEEYTVTVTCDSTKGTATLTPVAENNKYAKGTSVTLEVSAEEGYEVSEVKVNGSAVTLTEGKYTFTVQGNTEIVVSFDEKQPVVEEYTVTVTCDSTKGTATLTPVAENNKYAKGTSVTLEVSAEENYEVGEVKVNGSAVTLTEGKYTFTVQGNTEIVVTFDEVSEGGDEPNVNVSENLQGNYEGNGYEILIEQSYITITVSGKSQKCAFTRAGYADGYPHVYFNYKDAEYSIEYDSDDSQVEFISLYNGSNWLGFMERVSEGGGDEEPDDVTAPEKLQGKYEGEGSRGEKYEILIEESYVTITVDGESEKCAITSIEGSNWIYVFFTYNNEQYSIKYWWYDDPVEDITLCCGDDPFWSDEICDCERVSEGGGDEGGDGESGNPDFAIDDSRIGTYEGTDGDGKKYVIKLEKNRVIITVDDGEPEICYYLDKTQSYDIYFVWNGVEYDIVFGFAGIFFYGPSSKIADLTIVEDVDSGVTD